MLDYEKPVGFFLSNVWKYGPLYVFLPLAAQCASLKTPFTIEEQGTGRVLAGYDGVAEQGADDEVKQAILGAGVVLLDELGLLVFFAANKESLVQYLAERG